MAEDFSKIFSFFYAMEPLKDQFFNRTNFEKLTSLIYNNTKHVDQKTLVNDLLLNLEKYELKERLRNTTTCLGKHLNSPYKDQIQTLKKVAPSFQGNFFGMIFPDFVEVYGQKDFKTSFDALEFFTQYSSSEFAIRPFFKLDFVQTLDQMKIWSTHDNYHVRRLASEGSRPRLPWSFQLKEVIKNPTLTLPILKNLKKDEEIYVKKSVANHLNDFSKDHPDFLTQELSQWSKENIHTFWIMKHGLRTLIKNGNKEALGIIGATSKVSVSVNDISLNKPSAKIGESIHLALKISSCSRSSQLLVVDFAVHYMKQNGTHTRKVFKLKTITLSPNETIALSKKIRFENFSTRKHYPGTHFVEVLINGQTYEKVKFHLST